MFAVICDPQWKVLKASPEFTALVGVESAGLAGRGMAEFLAGDIGLLIRDGRLEEARLRANDGREPEVWLQVIETWPGNERVILGDALDATALGLDLPGWKCLDNIEVAVVTEDGEGRITFSNSRMQEMLSYSAAELKGKHWREIVPPPERRWVEQQLRSRFRGERNQYETILLMRSGELIPVIVNARPIIRFGRYQGTVSTFTDITERKQAESELRAETQRTEQLNKALNHQRSRLLEATGELARVNEELRRVSAAKSDFVAAVSHDLRTPMTTIIEGMSMVEDGTLGPVNEEQKKFLRYAIEDAQRLSEFINDILDTSKIEAGKITVNREQVSTTNQVARVRRSYEEYIREKNLNLVTEVPDPPALAFCDPGHYSRVLMNLLSNAIKYTPAGGTITIRVQGAGAWNQGSGKANQRSPAADHPPLILTSVMDTGVGIPKDQQHVLFGKFEQVRRSGAYAKPGSGLGLSLCKQLVELNGGTIGFRSEENKGSEFWFALPAYDELTDLSSALEVTYRQAQSVSGKAVAMLFVPVEGSPGAKESTDQGTKGEADLRSPVTDHQPPSAGKGGGPVFLQQIADALRPKTVSFDVLKILAEPRAVLLVSALPEGSARQAFSGMIQALQKAGIAEVSASSIVCREPLPDGPTLLKMLYRRLKEQEPRGQRVKVSGLPP